MALSMAVSTTGAAGVARGAARLVRKTPAAIVIKARGVILVLLLVCIAILLIVRCFT
jgi:hypothetical protein